MGDRHLGFKVAVGFLFVAVLATYGFYWLSISRLHGDMEGLSEFAGHLEASDNLHSAMYRMLLDARECYRTNGGAACLTAYQADRAAAQAALRELGQYAQGLRQKDIGPKIRQRTLELQGVFAGYQKSLDEFMAGDRQDGEGRLAALTDQFDGMFQENFLRIHDHQVHRQVIMNRQYSQNWSTINLVFLVQFFLTVSVGLLAVIYLDRVVLKIFSSTERMAYRDKLTGLRNRAGLDRVILSLDGGQEDRPRRRYGLIMLDIDRFKNYNDTHGHLAGDQLLRNLGRVIINNVRSQDRVVRYGGEEFLVVLEALYASEALAAAEKLRAAIEAHCFRLSGGVKAGRVTVSLGVAIYPQDGNCYQQVLNQADQRLYQAKARGRNRVVGPA